jgi:formylglycine-generating enzyme required for sulfatase activity
MHTTTRRDRHAMAVNPLKPLTTLAVAGCAAIGLGGCGGGGSQTSDLLQDVSIVLADYLVLDLATGAIEARHDVPDLATNSAYRRTKMVFKAVAGGGAALGQPVGSFGQQSDEAPSSTAVPKFYIGVFEVTQAQWQLVTSTTPWANVTPASVVGGVTNDPDAPAFNITHNIAAQALATASGTLHAVLDMPSDAQWEYACRAGGSGYFSWGNARDEATAGTYALVQETAAGAVGPKAVGSFSPNAWGIYDMHGNVWEMTKDGNIRGGSWSDTLPQARAANKALIDPRTAHALVGLRLVLAP